MNAYVYSNFCIEYACHTIRCQIRLQSYFYVLLVAGSCKWYLVLSLCVTKGVHCTVSKVDETWFNYPLAIYCYLKV